MTKAVSPSTPLLGRFPNMCQAAMHKNVRQEFGFTSISHMLHPAAKNSLGGTSAQMRAQSSAQ